VRSARRCGAGPGFRAAFASLTLAGRLAAAVAAVTLAAAPLCAAAAPDSASAAKLWVAFGLGGGQATFWSDQDAARHATTITASFRFGVVVSPALRVGLEANGWGLETSGFNDPAKGETVNELLLIAQVYPWRGHGWYVKGGWGWGYYSNHAPDAWGSKAFGAYALGAGYDLHVSRNVAINLQADWARGPLGSVDNLVTTRTGRRFRGWDLILGVQWH
jgi:hypothetical protein